MEPESYNRTNLLSLLMRMAHAQLELYMEALPAARNDPELFAHLTAWTMAKSEVRDTKVAFPPIALRGINKGMAEFAENAVAAMMLLNPRELVRAYHFSGRLTKEGNPIPAGNRRLLERALKQYLAVREAKPGWWDSAVLRNRKAMLGLYAVAHAKPAPFAQAILFDKRYPSGSIFAVLANLKNMLPREAAGAVLEHKIPFPIAVGALAKAKDPDILLALIEQMSGNELVNNTRMLKRWGAFDNPVLKSAYNQAIERAKTDRRMNALKVSRASEVLDEDAAKKIEAIQSAQLERIGSIEGDWLVLGDRSGSMQMSLDLARQIAALIAERVKGKVYLVFFNSMPSFVDVTGATLQQIKKATAHFAADGMTSIGCGLDYIREKQLAVNGIAIASDGGDNTPPYFIEAYQKYARQMGIEPTTYLFHVPGEANHLANEPGVRLETYEIGSEADYYSLPNIVKMLKTSRYSLLDEIMQFPLWTFKKVFND